jgi:alkylation response protein AidB-like acyl-CoA dehydrogenase
MNFDLTDDQQMIKRTARDFLASRYTEQKVRELAESESYDPSLWEEIAELGWPGIFIDESYGGQELGLVELAILMEELGYALAPTPFFSDAAAALVISHAASDEQKQRWLPAIASGSALATVGLASNGTCRLVSDAQSADVIVVVEEGRAWLVEAQQAAIEPVRSFDATRRFATVRRPETAGEELTGDVGGGLDRAACALAGELTGIAQKALELSVAYAREREQFGHPIGAFQAVSHRCAQMVLETEGARSASYYAAWTADYEPESLALAASMAKAYASDAGWRVCSSALQVHGGIGFTWEHALHFYLKRAKVDGHLFGNARHHREQVARLCGLSSGARV